MKSSFFLLFLILIFSVNSFAREFSKEDLDQVFQDSNNGNPKAQAYLASMYYNGEGVELNHAEAAKWWRKAAEQGNAGSQVNLGIMLVRGEGVEQDYVEAVTWYRKAAKQNDARGMGELGHLFYHGKGVPQDDVAAATWYQKSAEHGNAEAVKWLKDVMQAQEDVGIVEEYHHAGQGNADENMHLVLFLVLLFPFWGLLACFFISVSLKRILGFIGSTLAGGFICFVCLSGFTMGSDSSALPESGWFFLWVYLFFYYIMLANILFFKNEKEPTSA